MPTIRTYLLPTLLLLFSITTAQSAEVKNPILAADPTLPIKVYQGYGNFLKKTCIAQFPTREKEIIQSYNQTLISQYKLETHLNGHLIDNSANFDKLAASVLGPTISQSPDFEQDCIHLDRLINKVFQALPDSIPPEVYRHFLDDLIRSSPTVDQGKTP
ncbi:hypothetical protein [Chromobacterium violaceum]|uniref:hypothetical protein n=1 Tax=Chromobacterium violaceum TaxID=536 RepID=UPI00111C857F|nr:hypothetical protein [Chromobacterium violaceum]MBX9266331.1 hypothetical protein [Chromobacterium violaceum]QRO32360.1 hypothetical protein I6K04_18005 [Chromobacterium violaceum]QRQ17839.1 hypothetical protein I6K03_04725 [Chromobacterium violaceum]